MQCEISVVIPVYNVKAFIERCATSLMRQTFKDVEYIFVNDASTDGSIGIVESIISQYPEKNVRIIHHNENRGLPASRKTGYEAATGEYILNCDGDDFMEETMLEKMYEAVSKNNVDYAYCDFFLSYEKTERYMKCPEYKTPEEAMRKGYLGGAMKYNVWNKLIRRTLYEGVTFPVDHKKGGEDMIMMYVLSRAKSITYVPEALYHYVKTNAEAISEKFSEQRLTDIRHNADYAIQSVLRNCSGDWTKEIALFKLNVKLPFLITDEPRRHEIWKQWYPEANAYIFENKELPMRTKLLEWCADKNLWYIVIIYYKLIYKFLYNFLFK